jgi:orotate phosphoribosyltransferase
VTDREQLIAYLREHAVIKGNFGDFRLKGGARTDWFADVKQATGRPEGMLMVIDAVLALLPPEVTAIGGLTMGADPIAFGTAAVAATRGRPLRSFSVRRSRKEYGAMDRIAGALDNGDRVAIVDDAVTTGRSMREAADVVRKAGGVTVILIAVVARGKANYGPGFHALVGAPDLGFPYDSDRFNEGAR